MRTAGYGEYEAHKEDHEDLLDQLRTLMDEFVDDPHSGRALLSRSLADWFAGHFASFDARMHGELGE